MPDPVVDVGAVVVAYGSRDDVPELLSGLAPLVPADRVVVVDNGGDGSGDVAERLGAQVVRRPDNPGFGTGQNAGLRLLDTEYVLLCNPDARPALAGLRAGLAHLEAHPEVGAVQGAIVSLATGRPERSHGVELGVVNLLGRALGLRRLAGLPFVRSLARRTSAADYVDRSVGEPTAVETIAATAPILRKQALEQVGGFDEGYFLYGEDLDLCRRLRARGWEIVAMPEVFASHVSGGSSEGWRRRELEWWRGTMRFAAIWWEGRAWWGALVAAALRWIGMAALEPRGAAEAWRATVGDARRTRRDRRPTRSG